MRVLSIQHSALSLILLAAVAASAQMELLRPTADADGGANYDLGCSGQNLASGPMPLAYDGLGQSTNSRETATGAPTTSRFRTRIFSTWAAASHSYSALTLNVASASTGYINMDANGGNACISYSADAGVTWTSIVCDTGPGWPLTTNTVTLSAGQLLGRLLVGICVEGDRLVQGGGGAFDDDVSVYDIWTVGTYTVAPSGTGSGKGEPHRAVAQVN